jgi:methionine aminotransferase
VNTVRFRSSKLPDVGTTIFTVMSRLAAEHGAINLSQGFPDFSPPPRLVELVAAHMRAGLNQYAPMPGLPALREAIARQAWDRYRRRVSAETEITITAGGTEALFCAVQAVVQRGDEVVLLDPAYDSYEPAVRLAGGIAVRVPLRRPGFDVDWDRVRDVLGPRTRLIIVNTPHNPSGAVFTHADLETLADVLEGTDALVLADEVYEHMLFDGRTHQGMLAHDALTARSMVVSSFGKTYHATGWKVGACIAPAELTTELRKVHQFAQFAVATPLQAALADYMTEAPEHALGLADFYQRKRDHFVNVLGQTRFRATPSAGTYFQLADYSALSREPDVEFVRRLTIEHGVAAIPVSVFSSPAPAEQLVRFCFAKDEATLDAAGERLRRV